MKFRHVIISFLLALTTGFASSAPCVKIRKGESFACMKFTASDQRQAAKYGLKLGAPFKTTRRILLKQGWVVDRQWLKDNSLQPLDGKEMICGNGLDAACSTVFQRNDVVLELMLSGVNDGLPLVGLAATK